VDWTVTVAWSLLTDVLFATYLAGEVLSRGTVKVIVYLYKQTAVVGFLLIVFNSILISTEIGIVCCSFSATLTPPDLLITH